MGVIIVGSTTGTGQEVDTTPKAARVILYDASGAVIPLSGIATAANQTTLGSQTTKINDGTHTAAVTAGNALQTDSSAVTQPVSASSLPLPAGASTSANQTTLGNQTTKINDGTRTAAVTAGSALQTDASATTQPISAASLPLPSGAATAANQTTLGNQTTKLNDGTRTAAVTAGNALQTDASATTQPVSAASLPLPSGASTSANQTTLGNQTTKINDGTRTAAVTAGNALQVDGSAVNQPVVGTAAAGAAPSGNPVMVAGTDGANTQRLLVDTSGRAIVQGAIVDRAAMVAGAQRGVPIIGQSAGVGRIVRSRRAGHLAPGGYNLQALDVIEGATINSWLWNATATTMTQTQATGVLTQNAGAITTTATTALLTSNKQFPWIGQSPLGASFKALITQTTNAFNELGFGAPSGVTAIINNGAFFRVTSSGQVFAVTSFNGTETVSAALATLVSSSYYLFFVFLEDGGARFIVEDAAGVPLVDFFAQIPLATPGALGAVSHLPVFSRVYTSGTAGAAPQTKIAGVQVWGMDIDYQQPWAQQLAGAGRNSNIDPTTYSQAQQQAAAAAPTATAPTNTTVKYTNLGGEYQITMTAASENLLGVFGYTVPSPYTLNITEIFLPPGIITTAFGATATALEWVLQVANNTNPSTATGPRYALGVQGAIASQAVGTQLTGAPIGLSLAAPITVLPGQIVLVMVKVVVGIATGVYRGTLMVNGYFS